MKMVGPREGGAAPYDDGGYQQAAPQQNHYQPEAPAGPLQLVQRLDGYDGAGRADRMAQRDGAAIGVHLGRIQPQRLVDRGVASALMREMIEMCDNWLRVDRIELTVFVDNAPAIKVYKKYGFEIDLNIDGGGDWLVLVSEPALEDWSTNGVEVWFDSNNDVGGVKTMYSDNTFAEGNGYETLIFGASQRDDPDLAWGRISPRDSYTVEIAVKRSILEGDASFMVGMWAGAVDLKPALFDFNDHYTHEQAGTSLIEFEYFYPIKELSELDNTCRMAIGFQPTGNEPGLCPLPPKPGQDPPASGGCPPEYTVCFNFGNQVVCYCIQP